MPVSVNFDRASEYYDLTRGFPPGVDRQVGAFVAHDASLQAADRVLEIGIGTGRIALPLAPHVGSISGIDISTQMMDRLRQKQNGEVIYLAQGDALALPFPDASFDAIMITHVLHLVSDVVAVLNELARVLKPSGILLHCGGYHPDQGRIELLTQAAFVGGRDNADRHQQVNAQFGALGWHKTNESMLEYTFDSVPRVFLERVEQRVWSSSWSKSDAEIAEMAARIRAAIDEHFGGDADTPLETKGGFRMEIYTPPPVA